VGRKTAACREYRGIVRPLVVFAAGVRAIFGVTAQAPAPTAPAPSNRTLPPDFINIKVNELGGGKPFRHIDDLINRDGRRRLSDENKRIAGFSVDAART
jgi:hypothetical protein